MTFERIPAIDRREAVEPDLDEARLQRVWANIDRSMDHRTSPRGDSTPRWLVPAAVATLLAAAAATVLMVNGFGETSSWVGTTLTSGDEAIAVRLSEGSTVEAAPHSALERVEGNEREVRIALHAGSAVFDVVPRAERLFAVQAGAVEVRVVGTAFEVLRQDDRVQVAVSRGAVDVRRGEVITRVSAGERWEGSSAVPDTRVIAEPVSVVEEVAPPSDVEEPERHPAPRATADELFDEASTLRRQGQSRRAARSYARLLTRFPSDTRAPLVAFELGRLRLDSLGDARGAIRAFRKSIAADPSSAFAQDARARLVEAYAAAGDQRSCETSRDDFLRRYPASARVARLQNSCE